MISIDDQENYRKLALLEESEGGTSTEGQSHWGAEAQAIGRRLIEEASKLTDSDDHRDSPS
ncbi:hypothetical protein ADILRU_0932 [Leifsonia rubra CMS 76R]|nr:hypothetical protein ADILRU_0932 [Leifsonia rubra CMS 76R]